MKFSSEEANHLLYAWAAISFAFAVVLSGGLTGISREFPMIMLISAIIVGTGFILHEMAHKFLAQRYGCWAEFRKFDLGLGIAVVLSFAGFIFAAPGAVMISGYISKEQNGYISAAGPITNIILALLFFVLGGPILQAVWGFHPMVISFVGALVQLGFTINAWLAFFNLIPFGPLDGAKVFAWSAPVWALLIAFSGYLVFFL